MYGNSTKIKIKDSMDKTRHIVGGVPTASDSQLRVLGLKNLDDPLHVSYCRSQNGIDVQVEIGMVYLGSCVQGIQGEILLIEWHDLQELLAKTFF